VVSDRETYFVGEGKTRKKLTATPPLSDEQNHRTGCWVMGMAIARGDLPDNETLPSASKIDSFGEWYSFVRMKSVDVYIWRAKGSSVGHAMMPQTCSKTVLLSQFPHRFGAQTQLTGPNIQYSFEETYKTEARRADHIFVIKLANGAALRVEADKQVRATRWSPAPQHTETPFRLGVNPHLTTHCAWAVKEALQAGGLPLADGTVTSQLTTYLPDMLADALMSLMGKRKFGHSWSIFTRNQPWCPVPL
jgi:hypothetical protein